jgi:hypothetical protein
MILTGGTEVLGGKPVPVPLCQSQTSRGQAGHRTRSSKVRAPATNLSEPWHGLSCVHFWTKSQPWNAASCLQALCIRTEFTSTNARTRHGPKKRPREDEEQEDKDRHSPDLRNKKKSLMRDFTTARLSIRLFWDMTLRNGLIGSRRFGRSQTHSAVRLQMQQSALQYT